VGFGVFYHDPNSSGPIFNPCKGMAEEKYANSGQVQIGIARENSQTQLVPLASSFSPAGPLTFSSLPAELLTSSFRFFHPSSWATALRHVKHYS
jgi:hypothetical protein